MFARLGGRGRPASEASLIQGVFDNVQVWWQAMGGSGTVEALKRKSRGPLQRQAWRPRAYPYWPETAETRPHRSLHEAVEKVSNNRETTIALFIMKAAVEKSGASTAQRSRWLKG